MGEGGGAPAPAPSLILQKCVCSAPRIFKTNCKLFMCVKENATETEIIRLVDARTLQNKAA